jgi:hypothetical protein
MGRESNTFKDHAILVPRQGLKTLAVSIEMPPIDVESFRKAWDRAVEQAAGRMFGTYTNTNEMPEIPEIPKADLPYGNLNRRKLRIRR